MDGIKILIIFIAGIPLLIFWVAWTNNATAELVGFIKERLGVK